MNWKIEHSLKVCQKKWKLENILLIPCCIIGKKYQWFVQKSINGIKWNCLASPENGTSITLSCTTPNWYLDFNDAAFLTTMDAVCTNNG